MHMLTNGEMAGLQCLPRLLLDLIAMCAIMHMFVGMQPSLGQWMFIPACCIGHKAIE
jgi:hypothetical protein